MTNYTSRRDLYIASSGIHPDEIVGATNLECELDLRGITGNGDYEIPGYCTNKAVARCSECSLCNYGRDCHNNPVAL